MPRKAAASKQVISDADHAATVRAKIPVIGYALLGRLAHQDQTGYELSLLMGPPRNYTWEANHSQIYPVLAVLTEAGYVTFSHVVQESKPNKKIYRITEAGRVALREWVKTAPTHTPTRNEFNLKVASLGLLSAAEAVDVLHRQIEMIEGEIRAISEHLEEAQGRYGVTFPVGADHELFGLYSTITFSREHRVFTLQWYQWMLAEFQRVSGGA
ncbi:helix-turn-helix transcriptional regulator [Pandoraea pulmonicola]|uniref:Transcriptional regulator, Acidobacterial, PadR-family n=1 Tax=Pandoraea pulmonicola TaxID=93221 RepID=A0AAJ4ZG67_PANPU|nr:helix-turn-helix transcriptional regulator [Pandoraea pulmonicola]APD13569.1 hypothetical protein RO07_25555 [Pandoraea pulmonicola]SUA92788.1 transcriptional regulator, Acidobacterial, PadR-family [Pandoraea pulmonicola]